MKERENGRRPHGSEQAEIPETEADQNYSVEHHGDHDTTGRCCSWLHDQPSTKGGRWCTTPAIMNNNKKHNSVNILLARDLVDADWNRIMVNTTQRRPVEGVGDIVKIQTLKPQFRRVWYGLSLCLAAIRGIGDEAARDGGDYRIGAAHGPTKEKGRKRPRPLESKCSAVIVCAWCVRSRVSACVRWGVLCILCGASNIGVHARGFCV